MALLELLSLAIRGLQFLFAIIVLGLTGHVASYGLTPSQDSFLLFAAVWTCIVVLYLGLAPRFFPSLAHPFAILGLDAVTMIFWFAGFIALAVFDNDIHDDLNYEFGSSRRGCGYIGNFCGIITAAVVFGAFEWVLFAITTTLSALDVFRGRNKSTGPTVTAA
ncbi:hypothetical protein ACLMJK_004635 [Lecanora helva]